jgi:hypothetical protein
VDPWFSSPLNAYKLRR